MAKKVLIVLGIILIAVVVGLTIYFTATPNGRTVINNYRTSLKQADDKSVYETRKKVEDTCRSMISSYNADKLIYEQYKDSEVDEERSWANNAKIRANQTASTYNNYILKNSFVWEDNVPSDIYMNLSYLQ